MDCRKQKETGRSLRQPQAHTPTNLLPPASLPPPILPERPPMKAHRMPRQASMSTSIHTGRICSCQLAGESRGPQQERGPHPKILFLHFPSLVTLSPLLRLHLSGEQNLTGQKQGEQNTGCTHHSKGGEGCEAGDIRSRAL